MAYSRWSSDCDWYVFWETTKAEMEAAAAGRPKPRTEERLAIWNARNIETPSFTYTEVRGMLASGDLSRVPGFEESGREVLRQCMAAFIEDVDRDEQYGG